MRRTDDNSDFENLSRIPLVGFEEGREQYAPINWLSIQKFLKELS